jgi:dephospho-CoA kinase
MEQVVIGIAGLPGSGKTTASSYLSSCGLPVVRMGSLTESAMTGADTSEKEERRARELLRRTRGETVFAEYVLPLVIEKLRENVQGVVIEGIRSYEELEFLKNHVKAFSLLFIDTERKIRYTRLSERVVRPLTEDEALGRDTYEIKTLNVDALKKKADWIVENNTTRDAFYEKLTMIIKEIHVYEKNKP